MPLPPPAELMRGKTREARMPDRDLSTWRSRRVKATKPQRSNKARLQESIVAAMTMAAPEVVSRLGIPTSHEAFVFARPSICHSRDRFERTTEWIRGSNIPCKFAPPGPQLPGAGAATH